MIGKHLGMFADDASDYDLVLGSHSVHTSAKVPREAEARISAIQTRLIRQGRL